MVKIEKKGKKRRGIVKNEGKNEDKIVLRNGGKSRGKKGKKRRKMVKVERKGKK